MAAQKDISVFYGDVFFIFGRGVKKPVRKCIREVQKYMVGYAVITGGCCK